MGENMRIFPYEEPLEENEQYLKDRDDLFREHGNGWWLFSPSREYNKAKYRKYNKKKTKKQGYGTNYLDLFNSGYVKEKK